MGQWKNLEWDRITRGFGLFVQVMQVDSDLIRIRLALDDI